MNYTVTKEPKSHVRISCELEADRWEGYRSQAEAQLGKQMHVEGFREGRVPPEIVRREVGEETILMETARIAVQEAYGEIVDKEQLEVIGEPELSVKKLAPGNPFAFELGVAVIPTFELPDYRAIASRVERKPVTLEEKEVEQTIEWLRSSRKKEGEEAPELTDEFAKSLGSFENVEQLKASVRDGLLQEKEYREGQRVRQEILEKIAEKAKGEIPDLLVEREQDSMAQNIKKGVQEQVGMEFAEYLEKTGKTEEGLRNGFAEEARRRVRNSLVLREIIKKEDVEATEEELQESIKHILSQFKTPQEAQEAIDPQQLLLYAKGVIENEKVLLLLEELAKK